MKSLSTGREWGEVTAEGAEIWDAEPIFKGVWVSVFDKFKLFFYPKKFLLYRFLRKEQKTRNKKQAFRVLDVGCGTGATVIDLKKMFGGSAEVIGVDVVKIQIELAEKKARENNILAKFFWYDGVNFSFENNFFDAIYTSDVLGHVSDVPAWLAELNRILKPGGTLAMFTESKLGRHAYIRQYLMKRGYNWDPHAQFHISLYSKLELKKLISEAGFKIEKMYSAIWASFLMNSHEYYNGLQAQNKFPILRRLNAILYWLKRKLHPVSTALVELYSLVEMGTVGRVVESQGYVVLAKKSGHEISNF